MRLLSGLVIFLGIFSSAAMADDIKIPKKITAEEAKILVYEARGKKPNGSLDYDRHGVYDRFYGFQGVGAIGGTYGFFSVNVWTGDVWADWKCKRISSPALEQSQAEIKKRFTKEERKLYGKLHALKPECLYP